jgi:hypothetical protein
MRLCIELSRVANQPRYHVQSTFIRMIELITTTRIHLKTHEQRRSLHCGRTTLSLEHCQATYIHSFKFRHDNLRGRTHLHSHTLNSQQVISDGFQLSNVRTIAKNTRYYPRKHHCHFSKMKRKTRGTGTCLHVRSTRHASTQHSTPST